MSHLGMWMPTQKDGKNWKATFSVTVIESGERIENRVKTFRVRKNAYTWLETMKAKTRETATVRDEFLLFENLSYKISKIED